MRVPEHHWRCSRWRRIDGCIVPYSLDTKITIFSGNRRQPCPLCACGKVLAFGGASPSVGSRLPVPAPCLYRACLVCARQLAGGVVSAVSGRSVSSFPSHLRCCHRRSCGLGAKMSLAYTTGPFSVPNCTARPSRTTEGPILYDASGTAATEPPLAHR